MHEKLSHVDKEMQHSATLLRRGSKTEAALLYLACRETLDRLKTQTNDPAFDEEFTKRSRDCAS